MNPIQQNPFAPAMANPNTGAAAPAAPAMPADPTAQSQLYQALLQNMMYDEEMTGLEKQLARAEALRDMTGGPQMRGNGRVQTAANPLEFLGKGIQQYQGRKQANQLMPEIDDLRGQYKGNVGKVLEGL